MNITNVRIYPLKKENTKLCALATITIDDCLVIHDIKVIHGEGGDFISMPNRRHNTGDYKDIVHPINTETRQYMSKLILDAYHALPENDQGLSEAAASEKD